MVTSNGELVIILSVAGRDWPATVDAGFNDDLQLPRSCQNALSAILDSRQAWRFANQPEVEEDLYLVRIPFGG